MCSQEAASWLERSPKAQYLLARTSLGGVKRGADTGLYYGQGHDFVRVTVAPDTVTQVSVAYRAGQEARDKPEKPSCPVAVTRSGSHLPQTL